MSLSTGVSRGIPRTRSEMMLRWICSVPHPAWRPTAKGTAGPKGRTGVAIVQEVGPGTLQRHDEIPRQAEMPGQPQLEDGALGPRLLIAGDGGLYPPSQILEQLQADVQSGQILADEGVVTPAEFPGEAHDVAEGVPYPDTGADEGPLVGQGRHGDAPSSVDRSHNVVDRYCARQ